MSNTGSAGGRRRRAGSRHEDDATPGGATRGRRAASLAAGSRAATPAASGSASPRARRRAPSRRKHRTSARRSPVAAAVGVAGELLLTGGALVLLFAVYTLWGTGIQTAAAQDDLRDQLGFDARGGGSPAVGAPAEQPADVAELDLGDAYGIMRIPRFGAGWEWVMVEGVEDPDLKNGPGHYPGSADAGQLGNFSVAGHRSGHGEPFADFPELRAGDIVEIETADAVYVYELDDAPDGDPDGNKIAITDTWVVDPVPGEPDDTEPAERRITLTTCWPRYGSSARMYATGVLVGVEER
ncbi:class E sortase [Jiangella alba]|uniref:Sortase A n=1 Tax=Jiangella alba TaxID=561176 RepID=A0A1H5DST9_9ACTN|nr:class E sortase [Jiangella alba]SED81908.1 sortase A [Jiangella alba]